MAAIYFILIETCSDILKQFFVILELTFFFVVRRIIVKTFMIYNWFKKKTLTRFELLSSTAIDILEKKYIDGLKNPLCYLVSLSFWQGLFPELAKFAR